MKTKLEDFGCENQLGKYVLEEELELISKARQRCPQVFQESKMTLPERIKYVRPFMLWAWGDGWVSRFGVCPPVPDSSFGAYLTDTIRETSQRYVEDLSQLEQQHKKLIKDCLRHGPGEGVLDAFCLILYEKLEPFFNDIKGWEKTRKKSFLLGKFKQQRKFA